MRLLPTLLAAFTLAVLAVSHPAAAQVLPGTGGGAAEPAAVSEASNDPVGLLLQILQDETARAALVEQLQAVAEPAATDETVAGPEEEPRSLGRRIADWSRGAAEALVHRIRMTAAALARAPAALSGLGGEDLGVIIVALRTLFLTIAATVAVFLTLRALAIPIYRRLGNRARERTVLGRVMLFLGAGLMDVGIVFLAWGIGYAVAWLFFGESGGLELRQVLYLNAFLAVELAKAAFRLLLSPSTGALRPVNLGDWAARRLYRLVRAVISLVGYGLLLVLPIVSEELGFSATRSTTTLIWLLAVAYVTVMVIYYRRPVGDWLMVQAGGTPTMAAATAGEDEEAQAAAEAPEPAPARTSQVLYAVTHAWYWLALAWLGWLLLTVLSRPYAVGSVLSASARVMLGLIAALILSGLLGNLIERGITLPQSVNERVPLLERRLNRYVPRILLGLRILILVGVLFYAFQTLNVVSAAGFVASEAGLRLTGAAVSVILILLVAFVAWLALTSWVDYRLNPSFGDVPTAREQTLLTLLRNAATIAILVLAAMFALSEIGINIGPLIASAGVVGLAIGFGAQKMVQDIITGVFIQFENAINVGDVVSAGGVTGSVERLTVRSVSLRDLSGIYHIIPFSSVDTVSNFTRDFSYYVIDMGVAYRENVPEVKQAMHDSFAELRGNPEQGAFILGDLEWFGLDAFGDNAVVLKCRIKTWPGKQWGVGRAYNEVVKRIFDERGIEIPFPQRNVWFGEDREGRAPPLRVAGRLEGGSGTETSGDGGQGAPA